MNLAYRDVRHNLFRFVLTCLGLSLLMAVVPAMIGIYNGLVADALDIVKAPQVDLWVVESGTQGPFAEASKIPGGTRDAVARLHGVAEAGSITYQTVEARHAGDTCAFTSSALNPAAPAGPGRSRKGAVSPRAISNWWPTARPAWRSATASALDVTALPSSVWSRTR